MRPRRSSLGLVALALALGACAQQGPHVPATAVSRTAAWSQAHAVPGRVVVRWKSAEAAAAARDRLGLASVASLEDGLTDVVSVPAGMGEAELAAELAPHAEYAEPDYRVRTFVAPNDPLYRKQYALAKVEAEDAWRLAKGSDKVQVAVIDTGIDAEHPDLKGQIASSYNAIGWRGKLGVGAVKDENGHGTHVAGVVAASTNNAEGIAGMAPGCRLMVVKALGADGTGTASDLARGVNWAVAHGASVINMSVGCPVDARGLREAVARAIAQGVVVVAAMGNEGKTVKNYPAAYPGVIAVGATTERDTTAGFSTRGSWISVAAPGAGILSTTPTYPVALSRDAGLESGYGILSGTSMASPLVAGLAALVKSEKPDWSPAQVKRAIENGADALSSRANTRTGHGRIDAAATLRNAR